MKLDPNRNTALKDFPLSKKGRIAVTDCICDYSILAGNHVGVRIICDWLLLLLSYFCA